MDKDIRGLGRRIVDVFRQRSQAASPGGSCLEAEQTSPEGSMDKEVDGGSPERTSARPIEEPESGQQEQLRWSRHPKKKPTTVMNSYRRL